jgi:hypothetical protein
MGRYRTITRLAAFSLLSFLSHWQDSQASPKLRPEPDERPQPVLQKDDDAKTIIAKVVKAYGGKKAFSRWNCGYLKYKIKMANAPAQLNEAVQEDTFQLPGHFKRISRVTAQGKELIMVFVINNGKGWKKTGDEPAEAIDNDFTKRTEHPFAGFCNLAPLTEAEVRLTKLSNTKIDGREVAGVRAESEKLGKVDFYFSLETGLLLKSSKSLPNTGPDKLTVMESYLDSYKAVQGGKVPMRIKGMQDGRDFLDVSLIDVKFADKFEDRFFAKP